MPYSYTTAEGVHIVRDSNQKYTLQTYGKTNSVTGSEYNHETGESSPVWTRVPTYSSFGCLGLGYDSIKRIAQRTRVNSESYYLVGRGGRFGLLHTAISSQPDSGVHCCNVLNEIFDRIVMDEKSLLICTRRKPTRKHAYSLYRPRHNIYGLYRPRCDGAIDNRKPWQIGAILKAPMPLTVRYCESRSLDELLRKTELQDNQRLRQLFAGLDNG